MDKLLPKTGDIFGQSEFQNYQKMSVVVGKCLITVFKVAFACNYWHFDWDPDSELPEMSVVVGKCYFIYSAQAFASNWLFFWKLKYFDKILGKNLPKCGDILLKM